jgi:AICAR transformylase/IMP cyclohydrolase PurH
MVSMECITAPEIETGSGLRPVRRALLSVTDKTGLLEFARALEAHSVELVSTGGTARSLREAGLEVRDISDLTGFPEMLDGRVKTLHPKVHGGILHRRGNPEHLASIEAHAIEPIDMVVVNLYPFEKTAAKPGVGFAEIIENIDIGGPSMVRSAAKNFEDVAIVTSVADYGPIAEDLDAHVGSDALRDGGWQRLRSPSPRPTTRASQPRWRASPRLLRTPRLLSTAGLPYSTMTPCPPRSG